MDIKEYMIIYTLPVEFEGKIIGPSKQIRVIYGGQLSKIDINDAVRVDEAEFKTPENLYNLRIEDASNSIRYFTRVIGTIQPNPRGELRRDKAEIIEVWQRRS